MKTIALTMLTFVLLSCASSEKNHNPNIKLWSDVDSKATCNGYAFWLKKKQGLYTTGAVSQYKGNCKGNSMRKISRIEHFPHDGVIRFLWASDTPGMNMYFTGQILGDKLVGNMGLVQSSDLDRIEDKRLKDSRSFPERTLTYFEESRTL